MYKTPRFFQNFSPLEKARSRASCFFLCSSFSFLISIMFYQRKPVPHTKQLWKNGH
ncbi:hypothetical protein CLOLEP_02427 [[Clostridium] leptum DSM 753]|uniref:Uncharacterized protein n=1 Tax=[Clostridium] leptum DSM 753 TaxID=428125 RepID=A7VV22_9FIRM|nr:hypothetical protein CLOLEP_02427 [[Clostridium] leptum DSM 753]